MSNVEIKNSVITNVDKYAQDIIQIGEKIYSNPETGFKEFETSKLVAAEFEKLGLACLVFEDIPGVKVTIDTGREGPNVAILGELDSVICNEHPHCNQSTGAVHACGHNTQIAAMLGQLCH